MLCSLATNNGGGNHIWLLVRRSARGGQVQQRRGIFNFWDLQNPPQAGDIIIGLVVGQATNNGEEIHSWLLVRQTTKEIQSPTPAGGILIDHWARKIIHSCWSGDPPEADKLRQRRTSPTTAERRTSYARGGRVPTTAEIFLSLITIKNIGAQYA